MPGGAATNGDFLSNEPILLFLHGVGDGDPKDNWKVQLAENLVGLGYPELGSARVIAPKYAHALKGWDEKQPLPGLTIKQPLRDAAKKNRRDFERRMGAVEYRLGRHDRGKGYLGIEIDMGFATELPFFFKQAENYLKSAQIRAQVLNIILEKLPETGRLVIIGHSLGSVIAADLVRRLPIGLEVAGMVTIGSPLASGSFDVDQLRETLKEPPSNLGWWVNFWNRNDFVAARRGVSAVFPWILDVRINTKKQGLQAHAAVEYLADETVGQSIGFALFGSLSKEVMRIDEGADIPLNDTELVALLALRYAYLINTKLEGDLRDRYAGARRNVQATVIDGIRQWNSEQGRTMPPAIARLSFDFSDPHALMPEPLPSRYVAKDEAVVFLTTLASENIIRPFEIQIHKDNQLDAMKELTAEMGLGSQYGADVFASAKIAQEALGSGLGVNWKKWGALGAGAAAIVVATGGLALAAGAGLAGAAVITSALASFGPGGMMGGLLTAGSLIGAGGGGIAFGLASPGTTAETLEAVVERKLSAAILRQRQELEPDPAVWRVLAEIEMAVRREHERLDEFSDDAAPALKELKRKIEAVERALKYLSANGLEPNGQTNTSDKTERSSKLRLLLR